MPRYIAAVEQDIRQFSPKRSASTLFIGGGTPSMLSAKQVTSLIDASSSSFDFEDEPERSIEVNPEGTEAAWLEAIRESGINRLSVGGQTFDRRGLRTLGRQHEASEIVRVVTTAKATGFDNVSVDLIFGWPGQTVAQWQTDLDAVLSLDIEHLSLYSLIIEPGTPMAEAVDRKVLVPADEDTAADMYELAIDVFDQHGWTHYEIANWAREPRFQSRHNSVYWRNGEYAAFGAGAHGRLGQRRFMNQLLPLAYTQAIESGTTAISNEEQITTKISMSETMMLGLRLLTEGVKGREYAERHGIPLDEIFASQLSDLENADLIRYQEDSVRLTARGILLANEVCERFV